MMKVNEIYLGDAYKLIKEIPSKSVDLIITDPPYDIKSIHGSGIMASRKKGTFAKEIKDNNLDIGIKQEILVEFMRVMKKANIYIWCNKAQILPLTDYFVKQLGLNWELLVWAKEDPIPFCGTHYLCDKEYCLYFWETGVDIHIPYERGKTVYITNKNVADKNDFKHPTIKPIEIIENLIRNSCGGGLVLDAFAGSGTTCLAAKHLGLDYIGFEINETYYKIAKDRLNGINQKGEMNLFDI